MKTINLDVKERKDNCIFANHDYKKKRKGGANCYATAVQVGCLDTVDLIKFFVKMMADNYPNNQFVIEHDGIITFTVKCNDKLIFEGNHYDVEEMLEKGTYVFLEKMNENLEKVFNA